ncbi:MULTISPECIES: ion transporter [Capnocytophaga]|uniref:Ion transporter n=1 Tax=Capnocytophaga canis TaxID=1848903 RepID=A0A0B7IMW9_9FLAO|nr:MULTISPECIES: ion transporter [Capnocytophaga]ATA71945.1 ion transporter [Capnocytophaga sp. H4358]ATA74064.1 ion transporter [Capnocytophaga sp. H2931]RIY37378.1 ion transporter [Capnocytophaga canis]CEN45445.1 Potassium channel protein [Capnocytophaga canis]CEN49269.1 Potassium channel protein [Capnocytophaga canis]
MRGVFKSKYDILKQKAYVIIYGTNTPLGKLFDIVLLILIFLSVIMVMLESVKDIDHQAHGVLVFLEWVITVFFTLEYILRIISNKKPLQYIFSFYGIIDLISILPMYLSFFIPGSKALSVVRALRLLRVFRILDLVSFTNQGNELKMALRTSRNKIIVFIYFVLVICVLLGSVMYVIESEESGFTSIPKSIYWCIVTLTTVGYGDIAPTTILGQMIASFVMILGYGVIAVPTGIVTAEFSRTRTKFRATISEQKTDQVQKKCQSCGHTNHQRQAKFCCQCGTSLKNADV